MKCSECNATNPEDSRFCSRCGTPLIPDSDEALSQMETLETPIGGLPIGGIFAERYQIIEDLGGGGMGKVYKALDTKIHEKIALKLLKQEIASDEKTINRFKNELKLARKISHRNICRMFDLSEDNGTHYITMEYIPGEDLKGFIRRVGQLSMGKAVSIVKQVSEGLAEAHRVDVIHRDLKPHNIMIDRDGNARILDFGIARSTRKKGLTGSGVIIGTPEYMAPEQIEGKEADSRSDIYSLGVILYEMVTGRLPFAGDTPLSIAVKQRTEAPSPPRKINAQIPESLDRVILKCMEKDRKKRFQNAEELIKALIKIEEEMPTTETELPKKRTRASTDITVTFNLKKILLIVLLSIILVAAGLYLWRTIIPVRFIPLSPGKPSLAVMYFENNTGQADMEHWRKALSDLLITDLSQSKYMTVISSERLQNILEGLNLVEARSYSSDDLKNVAMRAGVGNVLVGKMTMAGDVIRIDAQLQEAASGDVIASERVEGSGESLFSMIDELTKKVKESFKLSAEEIARDIDQEVQNITTSDPEALRYYREAMKFYGEGDYMKSVPLLELAVAIDPGFAMAYRSIATSYYNLGYSSEAQKNLQKAFELSDRVSDRERYYIQAEYFRQVSGSTDKAIEAYSKLLELYPDDRIGNNNLGLIYMEIEDWGEAIKRFETNRKNKTFGMQTYSNLSFAYRASGQLDKSMEVLKDFLERVGPNHSLYTNIAWNYIFNGKYDAAQEYAQKALELNSVDFKNFSLQGDIYLYKGDLQKAEVEYKKLLESGEPNGHNTGLHSLAALYLRQGKFEEAKKQYVQGLELSEMLGEKRWEAGYNQSLAYLLMVSGSPEDALIECDKSLKIALELGLLEYQIHALHLRGIIYLETGAVENAQKAAGELNAAIQKGLNRNNIKLLHHLAGMIELEKGNAEAAIKRFKTAGSFLSHLDGNEVLFLDSLAKAYHRSGDLNKAIVSYSKIGDLVAAKKLFGDVYALSFYNIARLFQEKGDLRKARENYKKFLTMWEGADPGLPYVRDARQQLSAL